MIKILLELGGNNAVIVDRDADLQMALQAVLFAAVGTAYVPGVFANSQNSCLLACPMTTD